MIKDSTPFNFAYEFEDEDEVGDPGELFGDAFSDVTSYLNGILFKVDQRVVDELFMKISQM
jgi:hypothetical protein